MIETLNKYLIQHKSINIPGLGTIFTEHLPATFDVINKRILPPHYIYRFNKYFDAPDKEFFSYLAYERGVPDYEAIQLYNQFSLELRTAIKKDNKAEWSGVGTFTRSSTGDMVFEPVNNPNSLNAPVAAVRVVRGNAAHALLVGDQEKTSIEMTGLLNAEKIPKAIVKTYTWHRYALIVFAIAVLILIFHFINNGFSMASLANGSAIELHGK